MIFAETQAPPKGPFWKAEVRDFGRVARADIEMAPLVVLMGRNNTGKSYVASLLWAIMNFDETFASKDSALVDTTPEWYSDIIKPDDVTVPVKTDVNLAEFENWLNLIISRNQNDVVQRLLALKGATIGSLVLSLRKCAPAMEIERHPFDSESYSARYQFSKSEETAATKLDIWLKSSAFPTSYAFRQFFIFMSQAILDGSFNSGSAAYLPAARTGLMLALRPLVASALETFGLDEKPGNDRLPQPTVKFLQVLARAGDNDDGEYEDIARFLEEQIVNGKIVREDTSYPSFSYRVRTGQSIPLHASSSLITELAPFLLLLRGSDFSRGIVFEEPESHLHISAQRSIARAIVRLVNRGVPVVVTTHSDTFLQELNILMQMHGRSDRQKLQADLRYEDQEILDPKHVKGYEFIETDGRTFVLEAEHTEFGLVAQSLNETLMRMADEAIAVQQSEAHDD
jgi:hypothetical protein